MLKCEKRVLNKENLFPSPFSFPFLAVAQNLIRAPRALFPIPTFLPQAHYSSSTTDQLIVTNHYHHQAPRPRPAVPPSPRHPLPLLLLVAHPPPHHLLPMGVNQEEEVVKEAMRHGKGHISSKSSKRGERTSLFLPTMELLEKSTKCWPLSNNLMRPLEMSISQKHPSCEMFLCIFKNQPVNGGQVFVL